MIVSDGHLRLSAKKLIVEVSLPFGQRARDDLLRLNWQLLLDLRLETT
jgi:hypothetical protein